MEEEWVRPEPQPQPARPSLAEEQRRAYEEDQKRERKPLLSPRWPGFILRN